MFTFIVNTLQYNCGFAIESIFHFVSVLSKSNFIFNFAFNDLNTDITQ